MKNLLSPLIAPTGIRRPLALASALVLATLGLSGCHKTETEAPSAVEPPVVHLMKPPIITIVRNVGQPSFVEAYERTSIFPYLKAYIKKWNVDIGDKVKKGQVLAYLTIPELVEEWDTKKFTVELDKERVDYALKVVFVAEADVRAAAAKIKETEAIVKQVDAEVKRWVVQVKRLAEEVKRGVVDPQVLTETERQLDASIAMKEAALANVLRANAEWESKKASKVQDEIAVKVAQATLEVAKSDAMRLKKLVDYLELPSPFDGIVHVRNANTLDFVLPATGDPTAMINSPNTSAAGATPIYVIDRTDIVRIFVDIPEHDANFVKGDIDLGGVGTGTKATVLVKAFRDVQIPCTVTRTAWALNVKSRTLRAEIDLPNTNSQILPGMYAYGKVIIERPNVRALPVSAVSSVGEKTYYWTIDKDKKAHKVEIQTGISDGEWIEVTNRQLDTVAKGEHPWVPFDGTEQVIIADDLGLLSEGEPVRLDDTKVASAANHGKK